MMFFIAMAVAVGCVLGIGTCLFSDKAFDDEDADVH